MSSQSYMASSRASPEILPSNEGATLGGGGGGELYTLRLPLIDCPCIMCFVLYLPLIRPVSHLHWVPRRAGQGYMTNLVVSFPPFLWYNQLRYYFLWGNTGGTLGFGYPLRPRLRRPVGRESNRAGIVLSAEEVTPWGKTSGAGMLMMLLLVLGQPPLFCIGQNPARLNAWNRLSHWLQAVIHEFT
jgi:hypothetical protein